MRVAGYKLNSYNATYERTNFDIRFGSRTEKNRVLEVTDIESGITFIFEIEDSVRIPRKSNKTRVWRSEK